MLTGFQTVTNSKSISIFYQLFMVQLQHGITVIVFLHLKHRLYAAVILQKIKSYMHFKMTL